jgi:O-antigen/teichoic acid export membrane protein
VLLAAAAPITVALVTIPETLLGTVAGSDFEGAATALRILAFYPLLAFTNTLLWRLLVAGNLERTLLRVSASILALNIALNFALVPVFGYVVAAVTSLASEACAVAIVIYIVWRHMEYIPALGYARVVLPAAAAMAAVALVLPGPPLLAVAVGGVVYAGVVAALPGTVRDVTRSLLSGATRRLAS